MNVAVGFHAQQGLRLVGFVHAFGVDFENFWIVRDGLVGLETPRGTDGTGIRWASGAIKDDRLGLFWVLDIVLVGILGWSFRTGLSLAAWWPRDRTDGRPSSWL